MTRQEQSNLPPIFTSGQIKVAHGFSTRLGGVSEGIFATLNLAPSRGDEPAAVEENFRRFCAATGCKFEEMVFTRQVHGDHIHLATAADANHPLLHGAPCDCDGLITNQVGLALVIFMADCIPILFHDPVGGVIGAVHAGWRGTALGIAAKAVRQMTERFGSRPEHIRAAIGPGISACCFETDAQVPDAMPAWAEEYIRPAAQGKFLVDLKAINAHILCEAGVPAAQIDVSEACTMCESDLLWSHRKTAGQRGCSAAMISLGTEEVGR